VVRKKTVDNIEKKNGSKTLGAIVTRK